jgi:hypothetical protein
MTFATEIAKRRTLRSTLVRINPGRFISALLASEGGGVYALTMPGFDVSSLKRNGTALTAVTIDPPTVNDTYYFNQTTGRLAVKLASSPNSTTNVVICFYYLFYTSSDQTEYYRTPDVASGSKVYWSPRIVGTSPFNSSIDGIEAGLVSIPDASIDIDNGDFDFANYLTDDDSFSNKNIDIWHEVNGQFRKAYSGKVTSISDISNQIVSIAFTDQLSLLNSTAFMGDSFAECYHTSATIPQKDLFKPIPYIVADQSYFDAPEIFNSLINSLEAIPANAVSAVCTNFSTTISTSTNREWTLCRVATNVASQTFGTLQAVADPSPGSGAFVMRFSSYTNLYRGDTISWTELGIDYYAIILYVGNFTYSGTPYNVYVRNQFGVGVLSTSSTMNPLVAMSVIYKDPDGTTKYPMQVTNYLVSNTATSGGNNTVKITFFNNAEANFNVTNPIDPNTGDIQFKISTGQQNHATVLKDILETAGCTVNSASFTAAASASASNVSFSIPFINEAEYSPYLVYVQKILESMLGYLKQNDDNNISYHLLEAPTGTTTRNDEYFISPVSQNIQYQDLITDIVAKNEHLPVFGSAVVSGTSQSTKARYLHELNKSFTLNHVLTAETDGSILRQSQILAVKSNRRSELTYNTETIDLETIVGSEQTIETEILSGGTKDIFVTSVSKSEDRTQVSGSDLLGL